MHFSLLIRQGFVALFIVLLIWATPSIAGKSRHILIVVNSNETPFQEAVTGFKKQISTQGEIKFTELTLTQTQPPSAQQIDTINPDLVYTLGAEATKWASLQTSKIPIVATMVLKDDLFKQASNITGVSLEHSMNTQFQWLKKFFPNQKVIAILYNPSENAAVIQEITRISEQNGLSLRAIPVASPKELPFALEQLASNVELLLAIPDETVMSVNTAREVLLATFRNKVPFIGLSDNWVKSGAFYALSWDYSDLGQQSAVLAQKVFSGVPIKSISPEHPRKVTYTINAKIAEHMNMEVSEELLKKAKMVFN